MKKICAIIQILSLSIFEIHNPRRFYYNCRLLAMFSCYYYITPYNFISSMRSLASLMEPEALLSVPGCSSLA